MFTKVKTEQEIVWMKQSGQMLAKVHQELRNTIQPGMTTQDAAVLAEKKLQALGGKPAFLNYSGGPGVQDYPSVLCVSVNDEVVHGIPSQRLMQNGDVVSFDFGVSYNGMITDAAFTMVVGKNDDPDVLRLLKGTEESLYAGIGMVKDGVRVGDISQAIERVLKKYKLGIVREMVGHGVGHELHEEPNIPNFGYKGTGPVLKAGMTIAIEPMAMLGAENIGITEDGWTVVTADQSWAAHFEHTVLITTTGYEIITQLN